MKQIVTIIITLTLALSLSACRQAGMTVEAVKPATAVREAAMDKVNKTEQEWRGLLTPEEYAVIREKGTERPFENEFWDKNEKGVYTCKACGAELFTSDSKFDAGCGWPSFVKPVSPDAIATEKDVRYGMSRVEIKCARCGAHLGHVFEDGPAPTGLRYCTNSISMKFKKK